MMMASSSGSSSAGIMTTMIPSSRRSLSAASVAACAVVRDYFCGGGGGGATDGGSCFDSIPDDSLVAVLCLVPAICAASLLLVSKRLSDRLVGRDSLWWTLCLQQPSWILPKRPRKCWALVFCDLLERWQKDVVGWSDEVLRKCFAVIKKGDNAKRVTQIIDEAVLRKGFNVNYQSTTHYERNPLLSLAVMHRRHRTVAELLKRSAVCDIKDKGGFTPLLCAAWNGDLKLTMSLLHHGADADLRGHSHFNCPLKTTGPGVTALEVARTRKHDDVVDYVTRWQQTPETVRQGLLVRTRQMVPIE